MNRSVMKMFRYSFPIDFAFNMSMRCSERTTLPETIFYSVDFLIVIICRYFLFLYVPKIKNCIAFICVNPLLFLLLFIIFIVLLLFSINFECNFCLNFNIIRLLHLNCKILSGFLPIKDKSLGLLELLSKISEIWLCIE